MSSTDASASGLHQIVIVGGGAGGLELATALGNRLGKQRRAEVTLVDKTRSHVWKPKLHEIAAGSMDIGVHEVDFLAQAHWHHFRYRIGEMTGLDRARREVQLAPFVDDEGREVTPARRLRYDTLVIAVGSQSNDFGTPGVTEHALKLESVDDARRFNQRLVNACIRAHAQSEVRRPEQLQVAIIGAGATGVELAAELHRTVRQVVAYGLDRIDPDKDIHLNLIEAADRVLPALPERLSQETEKLLRRLGVVVHTKARVAEVLPKGVRLDDGRMIPAELVVWAAGVKAPDFLKDLSGLETNRINQLVVRPTLQTTRDDGIFAFGDCAACPWPEKAGTVPPRAQAAHQQASHMLGQIRRRMHGRPLLGVATPSRASRRRIPCGSVTGERQPGAPAGGPIAMVPPLASTWDLSLIMGVCASPGKALPWKCTNPLRCSADAPSVNAASRAARCAA
jgi:NADH dehydrogenase